MTDRSSQPYPALLNVCGRLVVVVGGTRPALRSAKALAAHGANVVVISADVPPDLLRLEADGLLTIERRAYVDGDLAGAFVAIAASGSASTDAAVAAEAGRRNVLINVPCDASRSDYVVPSVVRRGGLQIAVSTGGVAPFATREARKIVSDAFGWEWGPYVELLGEVRLLAVEMSGMTDAQLAPLFASIAASDIWDRIRAGEDIIAAELLEAHAAALAPATDEEGTDE